MKRAIIIHGMPTKEEYLNLDGSVNRESDKHWLSWLTHKLADQEIEVKLLEMPTPYNPEYQAWREELEKQTLDEETILVGHSLGAGFILRYLSETNTKVDRVALVAPFLNVDHEVETDFLNFKLDKNLLQKVEDIKIFYSSDDDQEIKESVEKIKKEIIGMDTKILEFKDRGHFTFSGMGTYEFQELLEYLVK